MLCKAGIKMDSKREVVGHELWPLKLKLLEANYEKSKLKIRESSLYCRLSIIQLKNIVDEEKFITEKYEKKAVAERLLVAKVRRTTLSILISHTSFFNMLHILKCYKFLNIFADNESFV